jgi:hypothetical protein
MKSSCVFNLPSKRSS